MATRKKFEPGLYRVTNHGKRSRHRDGVKYPGITDGKTVAREVEITNWAQWHRLKTCTDLKLEGPVKKSRGKSGGKSGGTGDGLDQLRVEELDEQLTAAELSTEGTKPEKVARLREARAADVEAQ